MASLSHFREAPGREKVSKTSMDSVVFDIMLHVAKLASGLRQQPLSIKELIVKPSHRSSPAARE